MCSEWFELVEKAKLSNEQIEQLTVAAQAQFKVPYSGKRWREKTLANLAN